MVSTSLPGARGFKRVQRKLLNVGDVFVFCEGI